MNILLDGVFSAGKTTICELFPEYTRIAYDDYIERTEKCFAEQQTELTKNELHKKLMFDDGVRYEKVILKRLTKNYT